MATSEEHFARYGQLRARLLAQHFAYSRHRRVNFLSLWNWLLDAPAGAATTPAEAEELKRWNVIVHGRENPLAYSAHLLAFLAVEHALGHASARPIIDLALDAFGELYKFDGDFAGYPTRWDSRTTARDEGVTPLDRADDFLVGSNGEYLYSVPATDPRHVPFRSRTTLLALKGRRGAEEYAQRWDTYTNRYRRSEPSMDEVVGLVGAYAIAFRLVDATSTRGKIRAQVSLLGDYLAEHGYLLVRPTGGFTARGATGAMPAYEYPIVSAFSEITGTDFASRVDFRGALDKAGYLDMLRDPILRWQVGGIAALATGIPQALVGGLLGLVQGVAGILGIPATGRLVIDGAPFANLLGQIINTIGFNELFQAIALYVHRDCFDVWGDDEAGEVAIASVVKAIAPPQRFGYYAAVQSKQLIDGFSVFHLPPLALSAVDGTGTGIGTDYWNVVAAWRAQPPTKRRYSQVSNSPFTSALALMHSAGATDAQRKAEEVKLVQLLDAAYDDLAADLWIKTNDDQKLLGSTERTNLVDLDTRGHVLNYLAGLALAWLYEKRRRDAGTPVDTNRFPVAPGPGRFAEWPSPTVPGYVVNRLEHVRQAITLIPSTTGPVPDDEAIDLFSSRVATAGALPLHPIRPTPTANFLGDFQITVHKGDRDVYTGIELQDNDEFSFSATGQIRGAELSGLSDPDGWKELANEPGWPLHVGLDPTARKFALLASVGGYFVIGSSFPRTRFLHSETLPLYLRINDSSSGGGGQFVVTIKLWGASRPIWRAGTDVTCVLREPGNRRIAGIGGINPDGSSWRLPIDGAIKFIEGGHEFRIGDAIVGVGQTKGGRFYLRTMRNKRRSDNLSSLPTCSA